MTLKQLKIDLAAATSETAREWNADSEKVIFFVDFCTDRVSVHDANFYRLLDYFEARLDRLL